MLLRATWVVRGGGGRRMDVLKRRVAVLNMIIKKCFMVLGTFK